MSDEAPELRSTSDGGEIKFSSSELFLLIVRLTNALTHLSTATAALARGQNEVADEATRQAGSHIDDLLAAFTEKMEEITEAESGSER